MQLVGVVWVIVACLLTTEAPAPASPAPEQPSYEPPTFTSSPDEPTDLPPPRRVVTSERWYGATRIHVLAGVDAPLELATGIEVAWSTSFRIGTTFGMLPSAVERAANDRLVERGSYARPVGVIVDASMERILMWRLHVAVQPWPKHGLLATAGYGFAWIHGDASVTEIAAAIHQTIPDGVDVGNMHFDLASRLDIVDFEVGWEWRRSRWSLRVGVGAAFTNHAVTHIALVPTIADRRIPAFGEQAATLLDSTYTRYVRTPLVTSLVAYEL